MVDFITLMGTLPYFLIIILNIFFKFIQFAISSNKLDMISHKTDLIFSGIF